MTIAKMGIKTGVMKMEMKSLRNIPRIGAKILLLPLIMVASDVYALKICKDENGSAYFTDLGCPEGTTKESKLDIKESNTYRARDSIDINLVNDYERRYNTGRSWKWVKKQRSNGH
jgi:hypothetical protein